MNGSRRTSAQKPMSIPEITRRAEDFEYNPYVPLRYWLRTADTLLKEARIYELEGNYQQAYLLLFRHANLVLEHLHRHPDVGRDGNRLALENAERAIPRVLARLETLKPRLARRYEKYQRQLEQQEAQRQEQVQRYGYADAPAEWSRQQGMGSAATAAPSDPALAGFARPIAAGEHRDLAVELAHKEIRRRETVRKATRQAGISWAEEKARRTAGVWGDWEQALARDPGQAPGARRDDGDELQPDLQQVRRLIDRQSEWNNQRLEGMSLHGPVVKDRIPPAPSDFRYPDVPKREPLRYEDWVPTPLPPSASRKVPGRGILKPPRPPELPPKGDVIRDDPDPGTAQSAEDSAPSSSPASMQQGPTLPPRPQEPVSRGASTTPPPAGPQPSEFTFQPAAYLENGTPLRTMFVPPDLRSTFLGLAAPNTRKGLETCGILCGTLISNALFVSRLVIPEQVSTQDTCETVNEQELFDYCDAEDLMVLGWIHTHPTQTCFMSSRDLHTHSGYQVMLPESIAIVCAPSKNPSWGVFRLTDPPGMKSILNCRQQALFHPHAESNIYTDALRPGHVYEAKGLRFEVADLRPRR